MVKAGIKTKERKGRTDNVDALLRLLEKTRRKASRLQSFGIVPEETSTKVLGHILTAREELLPLTKKGGR